MIYKVTIGEEETHYKDKESAESWAEGKEDAVITEVDLLGEWPTDYKSLFFCLLGSLTINKNDPGAISEDLKYALEQVDSKDFRELTDDEWDEDKHPEEDYFDYLACRLDLNGFTDLYGTSLESEYDDDYV